MHSAAAWVISPFTIEEEISIYSPIEAKLGKELHKSILAKKLCYKTLNPFTSEEFNVESFVSVYFNKNIS